MGIETFEYSVSLYNASAQKWGGVQIKIIKNKRIGKIDRSPVTQAHPIIGGKAPAAPPTTIL
tara:strand:+ start:304 stop:489 length:186 start_codon:yes stop_codon:yes gene_type:complete